MTKSQTAKIAALRTAAEMHGDTAQVSICDAALSGDAAALKASIDLKRHATAVGNRLEELAAAEKPNFKTISDLHFERQHTADKLQKAASTIANLEKTYSRAGDAIYNEANRVTALAGEAAVDCARARLDQDFSGDALAHVCRWHPITLAEDHRGGQARGPRDCGSFAGFANHLPELLQQIELAEHRIELYRAAIETRSLPDQAALNKLTPASALPVVIKPRRELTEAEQAAKDESMLTDEGRRLRSLHAQAIKIAGRYGESGRELLSFVAQNPVIAGYFPQFVPGAV